MDHAINGRATERRGNHSYYDAVPYGVYPCRSPGTAETGDDRWISISVLSDDQWGALAGAMGEPVWATPELEELAGRQARRDEIDRELAAWTAQFDDYELFHRLQAAGVPAAPVLEASRVHDDAQIEARGMFQPQDLWDDIGRYRYLAPFLRFSETPLTVRQPPVAMGEHNEYVYKQLLGVDDDEYARLEAEGHIAMDFDPSVP